MDRNRAQRGVSKEEWLEAGLESLSQNGVSGLTVDGLARSLGIARAGFYWHFTNREDLLLQLLEYWVHELTEVITTNKDILSLDPKSRLIKTAENVLEYDLGRYDMAIRQWAKNYEGAAKAVQTTNRLRLKFISKAFKELGFSDDDSEVRAMMFLCYHTWESTMFREISFKKRKKLIPKRIEILIRR